MKKLLTLTLGLLGTAFAAHAVEIMNADFNTYPPGDINGVSNWVASVDGKTNEVVGGELMLATDGDRIVFSGVGTGLAAGERLEITLDYHMSVPSLRSHYQGFGFGIQDNGTATATNQTQLLNAYVFMFALEPEFRYDGQVNFFPDQQQWTGPGTYVMEAQADCGMNPFGYYTNASPYDSATYIDSDSDVLRSVYTITKTQVPNEFNVAVSTTNLTSGGMLFSGSDAGIVRSNLWASSDLSLTLHSASQMTNFIQTVKMEKLDPVVAVPTGVSALGLDGSVELSWDVMPGATYEVFKNGLSIDNNVTTESYTDTAVVNGTTYSYTVAASYTSGNSAQSAPVAATPKTIYSDGLVYSTDFNGMSGDLAADADWAAISGSSNNAFSVITDTGTNWADTVATMADFNNVVGNAVYVDRLMQNDADDAVEGYFDVVISATASNSTVDADITNQGILGFGLTSSSAASLDVNNSLMALFYLGVRAENNVYVTFGQDGNDVDNNRLALLNYAELGWNPKPLEAASKSWLGNPALARDLVTQPIRVSWKIRKTREAGVYQAWASMSNLVTGATNDGSPAEIAFETDTMADMYDAVAGLFTIGHHYKAHIDGKYTTMNATVSDLSVSHSSGNLPDVIAPTVTSVLAGDREVTITWDPVLDAVGGYTLTVDTGDAQPYVVADGISDTTFTDSPRWNDVTNSYTLTANFDSDLTPDTASTNFAAAPIGLETVFFMDGSYGSYKLDFVAENLMTTNAGGTVRYVDYLTSPLFVTGQNGYTGPTLYALLQQDMHANTDKFYAEASTGGGGKIGLSTSGWNAFGNGLFFLPVSDMGYGTSTLDAVNNAPLSSYVYFGSWTWGAGNGSVRAAVRNGSTWYVSDTSYAANYVNGNEPKPVFVSDVAAETWYTLDISDPSAHLAKGAVTDGSGFTDVTAMGWYFDNAANAYVYEMEVKISGAMASYDYWAQNSGLVSSNSAAGDDPDMDTIVNELEYAYGGDPLVADTAVLPVLDTTVVADPVTTDDSLMYVYYKQRDPVSGITYSLKTTEDMINMPWAETGYRAEETDVDYYWTVVTNYVPVTAAQTFIKVDIQ